MKNIAHPVCCVLGEKIHLLYETSCPSDKNFFVKTKPKWSMFLFDDELEVYRWYSITYCPFCGVELPKIKYKGPGRKKVVTVTDGGYYCDTCDKRLNECNCYPPEIMWEIEDNTEGTSTDENSRQPDSIHGS